MPAFAHLRPACSDALRTALLVLAVLAAGALERRNGESAQTGDRPQAHASAAKAQHTERPDGISR